jgi:hypothetical protein
LSCILSGISCASGSAAAPVTIETTLTASYGSSYGRSLALAPVTWTFGFTFDPATITPTSATAGNGNTSTVYDGTAGVTGYLRKGGETATLDHVEAEFGTASLNRHSFTIRYVIDARTPLYDQACFDAARYPFLCPDLDQDDGLSFTTAAGAPSGIDANSVQFSFGGKKTTDTYFTGAGSLAAGLAGRGGDRQHDHECLWVRDRVLAIRVPPGDRRSRRRAAHRDNRRNDRAAAGGGVAPAGRPRRARLGRAAGAARERIPG